MSHMGLNADDINDITVFLLMTKTHRENQNDLTLIMDQVNRELQASLTGHLVTSKLKTNRTIVKTAGGYFESS